MTTYVALLRGVNVGGHRRVPMAALRDLLVGLGHSDVTTYLQSGNAVFGSTDRDTDRLAEGIRDAVLSSFGVDAAVLVRSAAELAEVVAANTWPDRAAEPTKLHVAYLSSVPVDAPDLSRFAPDEVCVVGRAAYLWYADGSGRSKLTLDVLERALRVTGTARNWTTATELARRTQGTGEAAAASS